MNIVNINFYAEGYYSGATYEENITVSEEFYNKISNNLSKMDDVYVPELDGKYTEVRGDIEIQTFTENDIKEWESCNVVNDGESFYESLYYLCNDLGLDLKEECRLVKEYEKSLINDKDYYLSEENCYKRLEDEFKKYGRLIFCVDFDDTLYDFHKLGRKYNCVIDLLRRWEDYSEVIILTGNSEEKYDQIEQYLKENNIKYKGINCDSSVSFGGRKTYANVYIDDRGGLPLVYKMLKELINKIESGEVVYERV